MIELLKGHTSPETAVVVDDCFRLRCKIRYWLEYKPGKGFRFCSQTTNPKKPSEFWNKPKLGVYCFGPVVLTRNSKNGHISEIGFAFASTSAEIAQARFDRYAEFLPAEFLPEFQRFIRIRRAYEQKLDESKDYRIALHEAMIEVAREDSNQRKAAEVK